MQWNILTVIVFLQDEAINDHYTLIVDHIAVIRSQEQGQRHLDANCGKSGSNIEVEGAEEWSSDEDDEQHNDGECDGGGGSMEMWMTIPSEISTFLVGEVADVSWGVSYRFVHGNVFQLAALDKRRHHDRNRAT